MATTRRPFAELLAALQQNKIQLTEVVRDLNARGAVQSPLHKAELAMLDDALAKNKLDPALHRLLASKLKELQASRQATPPPKAAQGGDATVVNPASAGDATVVNPAAGGDATVVNPGGGGAGEAAGFDLLMHAEDEKTEMGESAATTGFKPAAPTVTGSRTGSGTGGPSTSSWQRVATTGGPEREVHAGDVLKDRFYLEKEVGRGGMGIVFKARDERKVEAQDKNPWVAVKILNPEFRKHPQALVALQRESRKAQQLTHDNILRVYDFDKDGTVIYMTMEYCDAGALKDWIKKHPNGMSHDKGLPIIEGLARGLGRAHRDNIVHSDFKPGNVMMTADGTPKLFDMGIARAAKSGAEAKGETTVFDAGELGALTPAYASLEMIQGQPPELIDDIYALGITAYEILTGKHPFGKKNAEQAMKEGLKPPVVPGLSRRQQRTLQQSIAFKREHRIRTCEQFIEGMRKLGMKDYALPASVGAFALVVLAVGANWLLGALEDRRIDGVVAQFAQSAYPDTAAAMAALTALDEDEREKAKQRGSKDIQTFYFKKADEQWNRDAKLYRYPAALAIAQEAASLYPDSAAVQSYLARIDNEKKSELSRLNDEFNARVDANQIYEGKTPNIVETVAVIRQIDPANDLLADKKLQQRYTNDIRNALEASQFEVANTRAATALKVFPSDGDLAKLQANVKAGYEMQLAAARERELREKMTAAEAKTSLASLAANPLFTTDWQVNVNAAMSKLGNDTSPETMQIKSALAEAYAKQLASKVDAKDLVSGQMVADASGKLFPGFPSLNREIGRLNEARKAQEREEALKAQVAEAETLKRTYKTKTDANDVRSAQQAYDKLAKYLPPTDEFFKEGPKLLAEAYKRLADQQAEQGRYQQAAQLIAKGLLVAPGLQSLKDAERSYKVESSVAQLQAGASQPATIKGEELKAALDVVKSQDPQRYAKLEGELQNGVLGRLQAMSKTDPAAAGRGKTEWLKVFPQHQQLASLVIPEMAAAAPATTTPSLPKEAARAARRAPGVDTCSTSFATFGRSAKATCADNVAGASGPKLVVIPSPSGGYLAITKYEIRVAEFDAFCNATGKCRAQGGNDTLPRTNVSLGLARAYAAWLSEQTGFNYRLPTDAEWQHAASAGGAGPGEDFQCVVMAGGSQIKGGNAIPVSTGKANPWGLVNAVGNAAELTDGGTARGGHFNTPTSQCSVEARQPAGESETVGLRLVREMG